MEARGVEPPSAEFGALIIRELRTPNHSQHGRNTQFLMIWDLSIWLYEESLIPPRAQGFLRPSRTPGRTLELPGSTGGLCDPSETRVGPFSSGISLGVLNHDFLPMSEKHQREAALFDAVVELPPEERAAYLNSACDGDTSLRRRIESLLKADQSQCDFLDPPDGPDLRPTLHAPGPTERPGDQIGRYKLLQQIGEGGCGVVYMAEQTEPVRRRVALKVIKLGMDTKAVIARFEAERQALALMDHPNIAKVLDAGATDAGRPYFVMELVRGMKITDYCDEKKLPTRERLDLFVQVCNAIQHAHQKGIIHRDLKPSNILLSEDDGRLVPKVIDFGVAKATGGQLLTDKTLFTAFEQFIGTPAYMSPEQALVTNVDIDTRSDIYALGVLLYELMTGRTPFDAKELLEIGLDEMRRTIRESEPPKPSTRVSALAGQDLSTTAQDRGLDAPKLVSELRGDLDWIVMKCLEKDRGRRYETASGLAMDIERHLHDEPVVACPPSRWYAFRVLEDHSPPQGRVFCGGSCCRSARSRARDLDLDVLPGTRRSATGRGRSASRRDRRAGAETATPGGRPADQNSYHGESLCTRSDGAGFQRYPV